ncbi:MAG: proline dehydrogenase family protein [Cyclobacteriaceae bacterium]|nr:proline dehydrogenase family protein [Cyclobacteriaceae bacterium]MDH5248391.1 proline dehydrogenase family protein [Cyclobacteriaceae bacterium]
METKPNVSFEDTDVAFRYKSDAALQKANFIFSLVSHPWISALATQSVKLALMLKLPVESIIRKTVFDHFCGGESIEKTEWVANLLGQYGVSSILDYSVEGAQSEAGFDFVMEETMRTIEKASNSENIPFSVFKTTGLASAGLLEKVQKKVPLSQAEQISFERVRYRIDCICRQAHAHKIPVLMDAEVSWIQDTIDALAYEMMARYNTQKAIVFNTYQLYRTASLNNLRESHHVATMHNYHLGVKLVRGAYMEKERDRAELMGYPSPIYVDKEATDAAFNQALTFCIDNKQRVSVMCGSHNEYSNYYLTVLMEKHGMKNSDERVWFAQLYGMSDNISFSLAKAGYRVAKYLPYGPVRAVMPYLLRRAEENTSVAGQSSRELMLIRREIKRRKQAIS